MRCFLSDRPWRLGMVAALTMIGVLAIAFGAGFFASAILAYGLSERLGLLAPPSARPTE